MIEQQRTDDQKTPKAVVAASGGSLGAASVWPAAIIAGAFFPILAIGAVAGALGMLATEALPGQDGHS